MLFIASVFLRVNEGGMQRRVMQELVCVRGHICIDIVQIHKPLLSICCSNDEILYNSSKTHSVEVYLGLRLPWFRGRSCTRKVCLFLLYLVL